MKPYCLSAEHSDVFANIKNSELGAVNLIVGKNSIGKTHLLKKIQKEKSVAAAAILEDINLNTEDLSGKYAAITRNTENRISIIKLLTALDENLVDVVADNNDIHLQVSWCSRLIPLSEMGCGFQRVFGLATLMLSSKSKLVLIDDLEKGLHYSVIDSILVFIAAVSKQNGLQVLITTHSRDCLTAFYEIASKETELDHTVIRLGYSARNSANGEKVATIHKRESIQELARLDIDIR